MKALVYLEGDSVTVCRPAPNERLAIRGGESVPFWLIQKEADALEMTTEEAIAALNPQWAETEDEFIARIIASDIPVGADVTVVDAALIPSDRTFRAAWATDLSVDMAKARVIWRDKMRAAREPLLAALDIEYQRADERGDTGAKADVVSRKQALRDVTDDPAIDAALTPEDLKAVWPDCLSA